MESRTLVGAGRALLGGFVGLFIPIPFLGRKGLTERQMGVGRVWISGIKLKFVG